MADFSIDDSSFQDGIKRFALSIEEASKRAISAVAREVLRLSSFEVPHDKGLLQASGVAQPDGDGYVVGYNKVYASRLHEHPEYRFQKGRKGKYLEDPVKRNLNVFQKFVANEVENALK